MSVGGLARGAIFLFTGSIITSILGYVFWFLISLQGGVDTVGIAGSVASLSSLVAGIAALGLPTGVKRFLGREFGHNNTKKLNMYFWSSLLVTLALCLVSALIVWLAAFFQVPVSGFSSSMLFFAGALAILNFSSIFGSLFVSTADTAAYAGSMVVSAAVRVVVGVYLVYLGFGWIGALVGIVVALVLQLVILVPFALRKLRRLGGVEVHFSRKAITESLHAGAVAWIPGIVVLLGQQLGTIAVFGVEGSFETGMYYIAYMIFTIAYMLPSTINAMLFPALSGLSLDDRKDLARKVLKVCFAVACPVTAFLVLYPQLPLSLLGAQYLAASSTLSILLISVIPLTFIYTISSFVYSSGHYGKSIAIDLATSIPQVVLYFLLVPIYKGMGAAMSYSAGILVGLVMAIVMSRLARFRVPKGKIGIAFTVPFAVGLSCYLLGLSWFIGGTVVLLLSIASYGRMGVVERSDLAEMAQALASEKTIARAGKRLNWLLRIIYGD